MRKSPQKKTKSPKKKGKLATPEEIKLALRLAGRKRISPMLKKRVDRLVTQKGIPEAAAVTFVYYGGPRAV